MEISLTKKVLIDVIKFRIIDSLERESIFMLDLKFQMVIKSEKSLKAVCGLLLLFFTLLCVFVILYTDIQHHVPD